MGKDLMMYSLFNAVEQQTLPGPTVIAWLSALNMSPYASGWHIDWLAHLGSCRSSRQSLQASVSFLHVVSTGQKEKKLFNDFHLLM